MPRHGLARARALRAVPDSPQRALLYVRVSALMGRGVDAEDFHSPGAQVEAMRRLVAGAGLREVGVIDVDIDVSGQTFSREGLDQIRELVDAGRVDVIAVYDLSRLGRDLLESLAFIRWLRERGVVVMSAQERIDDSPEGQYFLQQFLGMAELRGRQIGREWQQIIKRRARAGKHHGTAPTGYRKNEDGRLERHPEHAPAMAAAFRDYAAGEVTSDVRRRLSAATGRKITAPYFKRMLANRVYLGHVQLHANHGTELVEITNTHDPLTDVETWHLVQQRLERERGTPPRRLAAQYSVTGIGRCARCGHHTIINTDTLAGGIRIKRIRCGTSRWGADGTRCPGCGTLRLVDVETELRVRLAERIAGLRGNVAAAAARAARAARASGDLATLETELGQTQRAMVRLAEAYGRDKVPEHVYDATMAEYARSEHQLRERLEQLRPVVDAPAVPETLELAEHLLDLWDQMTGRERNTVLRKLVAAVRVAPAAYRGQPAGERIDVEWW